MKKKILLVGCGNIGSRHLQALVKLSFKTDIHIVENDHKSRKIAESRLFEVDFNKKNHQIYWHHSLDNLKPPYDLVIVATPSKGRVNLIIKLLKMGNKKFLIEKIICQSKREYEILLQKMKLFNAVGWVNTSRRYFKTYKIIKKKLNNVKCLNINIFSNSSGLGTNSIHFIDLFSWFLHDSDIKLNGDFLFPKLYPSRHGKSYKEFYGTLLCKGKNNSSLTMTFLPSHTESILITISSDSLGYVIDELNDSAYELGKNPRKICFKYEHVSNLTTLIVRDILKENSSSLPKLDESYNAHFELFRVFNSHLKKQLKRQISLCPIT